MKITIQTTELELLTEKAIYIEQLRLLLVSDVHLGKSETFQAKGIPIANIINQVNLERLKKLCDTYQPEQLIVLGDLFHSRLSLVPEVLEAWQHFLNQCGAKVQLLVGNHDRALIPQLSDLSMQCVDSAIQCDRLLLSHEPLSQSGFLNICGHIHPCLNLKTRLDRLRLPCFYYSKHPEQLILPSFGEFTGGYEITLKPGSVAYVIADNAVIPFEGK